MKLNGRVQYVITESLLFAENAKRYSIVNCEYPCKYPSTTVLVREEILKCGINFDICGDNSIYGA